MSAGKDAPPEDPKGTDESDSSEQPEAPEAIDFATFVLSLSTSALVHLGAIPSPDGFASSDRDVANALARQTIDILAMLEQKTRGNLSGDEERLIHEVLVDLRLRYVHATRTR